MSDFTKIGDTAEETAGKLCRKCEQPVKIRSYSTPDTPNGKGVTVSLGFCACSEAKAAHGDETMRRAALAMVVSDGGQLSPGAWRGAKLEDFDWYIDTRFRGAENFPCGAAPHRDALHRYLATLPERIAKGQGLYFTGDRGMGKSRLLATILTAAAEQGVRGRFEQVAGLCKRLAGRGPDADAYLAAVRRVPILGLDDLGTEAANPWNLETLTAVIDSRYADRLPTLVTTNLTSDELQARYGERDREAIGRLLDRLLELNKPIRMYGDSYRQKLREEW